MRARARLCVCVCVCVCVCFHIIPYVNRFGRTVLYGCIGHCIWVNMYDESAQGVDERIINVYYYHANTANSACHEYARMLCNTSF